MIRVTIVSTFEMVKRLRKGQQAVGQPPLMNVVVEKDYTGSIIVLEDDYSSKYIGKPLPMTSSVLQATWNLKELRISFDKAVEHVKAGNTVRCQLNDNIGDYEDYSGMDRSISFREIIEGKWSLVKEDFDEQGNPLVD